LPGSTLLNPNDQWFNFDHQQAHQAMWLKEPNSTNFSVLPYLIDPSFADTSVPAGWGNTLHAQAHADYIGLFPPPYGGSGLTSLNDVALAPEPSPWWQFSNFQLHYIANLNF
jgi:hypothetical protein